MNCKKPTVVKKLVCQYVRNTILGRISEIRFKNSKAPQANYNDWQICFAIYSRQVRRDDQATAVSIASLKAFGIPSICPVQMR